MAVRSVTMQPCEVPHVGIGGLFLILGELIRVWGGLPLWCEPSGVVL